LEVIISFELGRNWSIVEDFLSDLDLSWVKIVTINIIAVDQSRVWLALREVRALNSFCFSTIRCTFFGRDATLLSKVPIKDRPAAAATLSHVIACHDELDRQIWHVDVLMRVFHLHSAFDSLNKTVCVAGTTCALIPEGAGEVVPTDVSQVEFLWHFVIWNVIRTLIVVSVLLCFVRCCLKLLSLLAELFLSGQWILGESFLQTVVRVVICSIELVQYGVKRAVCDMVHISLLFFDIWLHFESLLREACSLVESRMICGQHAHVWYPVILLLIVCNFNNPLVHFARRLEALEQVTFLDLHAC